MTKKVVTMGELLLRLSPEGYERFYQANKFNIVYGGAEANVAVSLANFGLNSYFFTKVPDNPIGESGENYLRKFGVKTDYINKGGKRMGIYFFEKGNSIRPSKVVYDRENSAITEAKIEDFHFDDIFKDADWFHFSGITPALGENCVQICKKAVETAKKYNVPISIDLNYRSKLWSLEDFEKVMSGFLKDIDVCIGWLDSLQEKQLTNCCKDKFNKDNLKVTLKNMQEKFNIKYVVTTLRENYSASFNGLSAIMYNGKDFYESKKYEFNIQDRVGAGDAFAGGLIYKLVSNEDYKEALEFAVAAAVLKHTIDGDFNLVLEKEVMEVVQGNCSGAVKR